jgi:hypothetical protein
VSTFVALATLNSEHLPSDPPDGPEYMHPRTRELLTGPKGASDGETPDGRTRHSSVGVSPFFVGESVGKPERSGGAAEAAPAALENVTDNCSSKSSKKAVNRRRHDYLRRKSVLQRQRVCTTQTVAGMAFVIDRKGNWRCAGLRRCGRVDCPSCGVVILTERQADIELAADRWVRYHGGTLVFVTLTFGHSINDTYASSADVRQAAFRAIASGSSWQRDRELYGIVGFIRVNEDTWGDEFGWHCHIHALFFLSSAPGSKETAAAIKGLGRSSHGRWSASVVKSGRKKPSRLAQKAVEVTGPGAAQAMGDYLTKQFDVPKREMGAAMARELVGGSGKNAGRNVAGIHYSVTELLDAGIAGDERAKRVYAEREKAALGRRTISWSNGLRELIGLREEEEDEVIAQAEDEAKADDVVVLSIPQSGWSKLSRLRYGMGRLYEVGETGGVAAAMKYLDGLGVEYVEGYREPGEL